MTEEAGFLLATVAVGDYVQDVDRPYSTIEARAETEEVATALEPYGATRWSGADHPGRRPGDYYASILDDWSLPRGHASSMLLWVGHGEIQQGSWLATPSSQHGLRQGGVTPAAVGEAIVDEWFWRKEQRGAWTILVVEACGAGRFVRMVESHISAPPEGSSDPPARIALIGAGGRGEAFLGTFRKALVAVLERYDSQPNTHKVSIADLVRDIEDQFGDDVGDEQTVIMVKLGKARPIVPQPRALSDVTGAVDVLRELELVYQELQNLISNQPADQQFHFIPKAQGAEQGELAWYFEGRAEERKEIRRWIDAHDTGMLVVTGSPGSGKSALLGNLVVHATEPLRDLLVRLKKLDVLPEDEDPAPAGFRESILLTGVSAGELVDRLTLLVGGQDGVQRLTLEKRIEHLMASAHETPVTLMADALDEAQDPFRLARILRQFASVPGCRVVLGTRGSTQEGPDLPRPKRDDIIDELRAGGPLELIRLAEDSDAVERYVTRRLSEAYGNREPAIAADTIAQVARDIGARKRAFLYARLAVHELINAPELLTKADRAGDLDRLLGSNHGQLFGWAVERLRSVNPGYEFLLEALAYGKGRGLPRTGRVWRLVANALTGEDPTTLVTETDIDGVLRDAGPYIMLDGEDGQSVYRLAHRTFQEFFLARGTS